MIASVRAATSPRFAHRVSPLAIRHSAKGDLAAGTSRRSARTLSARVWMRPGAWLLLVGLMVLCGPTCAEAQQATPAGPTPWRVYFGGSALLSSQPAGGAEAQPGEPGLGGTGLGLSAIVGAGGRVSLEGEVTRGASLSSTWQDRSYGVATYSINYRDTLVSAFVRWRANPGGRAVIEPVGGITLAFGRGTLTADSQPPSGSSIEPFTSTEHVSKTSLGLGGGVDVLVPVSALVSIAGSARLHRFICNDVPLSYAASVVGPALGDWVLQFGGGVQVSWARSPSNASQAAGPAGAGDARKEASPDRGYVGGTIMVIHQPEGYADGHYLSRPLGGTGAGFSGIVGAFITRNLSLETEVSVGPTLTAEQWFINLLRYSTSYRDTLLSGFLRWHRMRFTHFAIEPVGGLTIAAGHAARTAQPYQFYPPGPIGSPFDDPVTRITFGVGGGADLVVPAGRSLAITGSFRLHVLDRDDERDGPPELGIGPWIYQFGGGVRWAF
jgi:hypothetical protein